VTANVTNTVSLVFVSVGSVSGSRPELRGQARRVRALAAAAVCGGAVGAGLLLLTPSDTFERLAPWLIGVASLAILWRPRPAEASAPAGAAPPAAAPSAATPSVAAPAGGSPSGAAAVSPPAASSPARATGGLVAGAFLVAVYGGYFGAAAGVMLLALMLLTTREPLARSNALKNVTLGVANAAAAVGFIALGPVHWPAVPPLAAGFLAGGRLGPIVVRHSNDTVLRTLIGLAGIALAVKLGIDAY
jgi:uncharacterized membrane protein YfcA